MKKNRGRSKFFKCFKPAVIGDDDHDGGLSSVKLVGGSEDGSNGQVMNVAVSPRSLESSSSGEFDHDGQRCPKEKSVSQQSFSKALKAVFFGTSLKKKIRSKKARQDSFWSSSLSSSKAEKILNSINEKTASQKEASNADDTLMRSSTSNSSLFSSSTMASPSLSSSCASSIASHSRSGSERTRLGSFDLKQDNAKQVLTKEGQGCYSSSYGLCFLVVCLLALILWGKVFAIFCTSAWLFWAPPCSFKNVGSTAVIDVDSPDFDWEEHKKKVIMEGLLERNRSRAL